MLVQSFMLVKELQGGRSKEKKRKAKTEEKVLRKYVLLKSAPVRARLARNSSCHPHGRQRWCRQEAEGATSPLNERLTVAIELAAALHYSPVVWGLRCAALMPRRRLTPRQFQWKNVIVQLLPHILLQLMPH